MFGLLIKMTQQRYPISEKLNDGTSRIEFSRIQKELENIISELDEFNLYSSFKDPSTLDKAVKAIQESIEWIDEQKGLNLK